MYFVSNNRILIKTPLMASMQNHSKIYLLKQKENLCIRKKDPSNNSKHKAGNEEIRAKRRKPKDNEERA